MMLQVCIMFVRDVGPCKGSKGLTSSNVSKDNHESAFSNHKKRQDHFDIVSTSIVEYINTM